MKYSIILFALIGITACTKKKDHKQLIIYGRAVDSTSPLGYNDSFYVTYSPFSRGSRFIPLTGFRVDSAGNFRFNIDQSFAGDSITIVPYLTLFYGTIKIPATAVDSFNAGIVSIQ